MIQANVTSSAHRTLKAGGKERTFNGVTFKVQGAPALRQICAR
jgi:hypothetical protein